MHDHDEPRRRPIHWPEDDARCVRAGAGAGAGAGVRMRAGVRARAGTGVRAGALELDRRLLAALRDCGADPRVAAVARTLSAAGEHGALWLAAGLGAAVADRTHRGAWLRGTALTGAAHLASMGVKRLVRRPRPARTEPLVSTVGRHSFPSSHATSAAAAAVACGALRPGPLAGAVPPLAAAMCVARLVVGVHYPSDVAAGALLGGLLARLGTSWITRPGPPRPVVRPKGRPHV